MSTSGPRRGRLMLERLQPVLKVICAALAALVLFQVVRLVVRSDPLAHLNIPALPTMPPDTNAPTGTGTNRPAAPGSAKSGTNTTQHPAQNAGAATNSHSVRDSGKTGTNAPPSVSAPKGTNPPSRSEEHTSELQSRQ